MNRKDWPLFAAYTAKGELIVTLQAPDEEAARVRVLQWLGATNHPLHGPWVEGGKIIMEVNQ